MNNPLYEARLNNFEYEKWDVFIDRLMAQWFLTDYLHLKGQIAITKEFTKKNVLLILFLPTRLQKLRRKRNWRVIFI